MPQMQPKILNDGACLCLEVLMNGSQGIRQESKMVKNRTQQSSFLQAEFLFYRGVVIGNQEIHKTVKSALNKATLSRSKGQEGALTQRCARRAAVAPDMIAKPLTDVRQSRLEAPFETGAPAMPPPSVAQLFEGLNSHVSAAVKIALRPVEEHVEKLEQEIKELREDSKKLRTDFEGECIVAILWNKVIVAYMSNVREQLEDVKKTLDDFKTEADPHKIPGDIPDVVTIFCDTI
ncbi:hypothetical protein CJ030_MR5G023957 [Morella rubra]|uniref:Uncharacterized protein n=1 Tax=Morella rubra TaxID=262757 RepID=A0A6A1VIJ2_9ROSI|nr:hypothetical protein CJ030_MR5G023957 [Morella rubra]